MLIFTVNFIFILELCILELKSLLFKCLFCHEDIEQKQIVSVEVQIYFSLLMTVS